MIIRFPTDPDKLVMALFGQLCNEQYFNAEVEDAMRAHWDYIDKLVEEVRETVRG